MTKEIIESDNIKCGGCANSIKCALEKIVGVKSVAVSTKEGTVEIEYKEESTRQDVLTKLAAMGYPERGTSTLLQKGKSYVQCMIGRVNS